MRAARRLQRYRRDPPPWKMQLIGRYTDSGVFVDVGANVGQTLREWLATSPSGTYVGFEPIPACAAQVQSLIDATCPGRANVVSIALTERPHLSELYIPGEDTSSGTLLRGLRPERDQRTVFVAGLPLDVAWPAIANGPMDLIKIDVEGGELDALSGMKTVLREHQPPVICEVLRRDALAEVAAYTRRVEGLTALLADLGYTTWRIVKPTGRIEGYERIDRFPSEPWAPDTAEDNDYLLLPSGERDPGELRRSERADEQVR